MNNIVIKGRLVRDVEMKCTSSGKEVVHFCVAVDRRFKKDAVDFFNCQAWDKTAAFIHAYFKKGQEILINGAIESSKYMDNNGENRIAWEVNVNNAEFCGSKADNNQYNDVPSNTTSQGAPAPTYNTDFDEVPGNDDDLPF